MEKFAERLKTRLREMQMSQKELAVRIGTSQWTISQYVNGKGEPNEARFEKIAEILDCDVNWLKGIDEEVNNNDIKRNAEGYYDPTAYKAIKNTFDAKVNFRRGEIYYITNGYYKDHGGTENSPGRPAVIVSNDRLNAMLKHVEVVYLTSRNDRQNEHNVAVMCRCPSTALCGEVSTVNKDRLNEYIRTCTAEEMAAIDKALMVGFGISAVTDPGANVDAEKVKALEAQLAKKDDELEEAQLQLADAQEFARRLLEEREEACNAITERTVIELTTERDLYKQQYEMLLNKLIDR